MSHHSIDISKLSYTYPDGTPGLREVTLHVGHGESITIVGGNGAGKDRKNEAKDGIFLEKKTSNY